MSATYSLNKNPQGRNPTHTLATIPIDTLLSYVKKEEITHELFTPAMRQEIELKAVRESKSLTKKLIKEWLLQQNPQLQAQFYEVVRKSPVGERAFQRYTESYKRITDPANKAKSQEARKVSNHAKQQFLGCLASKVDPKIFSACVDSYDNLSEYEDIGRGGIVPYQVLSSAKQKAGISPLRESSNHISYLPSGLREYVLEHEDDYMDYVREREDEIRFLQSVRRNALKALHSGQSKFTVDVPQKEDDEIRPLRKRANPEK